MVFRDFPIIIPIVIQNVVQRLKSHAIISFKGILVHLIALYHCAKEQLAWLDVVHLGKKHRLVTLASLTTAISSSSGSY